MKKLLLLGFALCTVLTSQSQEVLVYASDRANNAVNKYDVNGNFLEVFIPSNSGGLSNPQDLVFHPDGTVLISGFFNNTILRYDLETGDYLGPFSNGYPIQGATRMELRDDLIYVLQWNSNYQVIRFDLDGNFVDEYTNIGVFQSIGIDWDADNNLYVSSYGNGTSGNVQRYDENGDLQEIFGETNQIQGATNIWFTDNGDLWAMDYNGNRIMRFDSDGNHIDDVITGVANPEGFAYLPDGNLLVSERGADKITLFDPAGNNLGRWDNGGNLSQPNFIRVWESSLGVTDALAFGGLFQNTIGTSFRLSDDKTALVQSIALFDLGGRQVAIQWDAEQGVIQTAGLNRGLYIAKVKLSDGQTLSGKLLRR